LHVVRRSDRLWAGISTDLAIEQVLMRSLKATGGLTSGRGMTERQRLIWVLSKPASAEVNLAMQQLTGVNQNTGEQNKDMTASRQSQDWKDTQMLLHTLNDRNPFQVEGNLSNIANGIQASDSVNVDVAKDVGLKILNDMTGKTPASHSFKRKDQAVTLAAKTALKINGETVQIDPQLLFQRLTFAAKSSSDMEAAFQYELCSYPTALFDSAQQLREAQKSQLSDAIGSSSSQHQPALPEEVQYVLDGGALLQRIPWMRGSSFKAICRSYIDYVSKKYDKPIVVFDGYDSSTTKDMTHRRRTKGKAGVTVSFTEEMNLTMSKDVFLTNKKNKQR
jgi:hypothetical protein